MKQKIYVERLGQHVYSKYEEWTAKALLCEAPPSVIETQPKFERAYTPDFKVGEYSVVEVCGRRATVTKRKRDSLREFMKEYPEYRVYLIGADMNPNGDIPCDLRYFWSGSPKNAGMMAKHLSWDARSNTPNNIVYEATD